MWTEINRYTWTAYMSPADIMMESEFTVGDYFGGGVNSYNLATRGYGAYVRCKTYPKPHKRNGRTYKGSSRLIFTRGKSQIIFKVNQPFHNKTELFDYLKKNLADAVYIQDENRIVITDNEFSMDDVLEKFSMTEILEYHNRKKYREMGDKIKPTPVITFVPNQLEELKEAV